MRSEAVMRAPRLRVVHRDEVPPAVAKANRTLGRRMAASHARYLALNPIVQVRPEMSETVENRARDQIEYPNEEPWIRQKFEEELAKRGTTSLMPEEAYGDRDYKWKPAAVYQAVTPVA